MDTRGKPMRRTTPWGRRTALSVSALFAVAVLALSAHADEKTLNTLQRLDIEEGEKATQIVVRGSSAPTFTVFKLKDPVRLFIDVSNADISGIDGPFEVENGVISQVSTLQFNDDLVRIGRVIVGLDVDALYSVRAEGNDLVVKIDGSQRKAQRPVVVTKTIVDDSALAAARARVLDAQSRAKAAEERARAADARAQAAAQTAEASTAAAEARAAQAESRARTAEATAQQEAADAAAVARSAAQRADAAEARAVAAERDAEAARAAAAASNADTRSVADEKVLAAERRARDATQVAAAARTSAQAAQVALQAKSTEVEARMAEAQARAAEAEARARKAESEAQARGKEATSHARAARAAEARARNANATVAEAEARAKAANDRLVAAETRARVAEARANTAESRAITAESRATTAENRANTAENRASTAETRANTAENRAVSAESRASAAEAQASSAQGRARAAEARAIQAETAARDAAAKASAMAQAATEASERAKAAEAAVAALKNQANSKDAAAAATAQAQIKAAEADARATAAEARARNAEAEQARLAEKTAAIEAARQDAKAEVERLRSEQTRLSGQLRDARAVNNATKAERLQAEQTAQEAKLAAENARVAQLESARQASDLDERVAQLESKLTEAKQNDRSAEAAALERDLSSAKGEAENLRSALRSRESDLAAARSAAEASRLEAERLKAALAAKAEEAAAAKVQASKKTIVRSGAPLRVQHVQFADTGDRTEIQIRVKGSPDYTVRAEGERTRILEFNNALVDPAIERSLDTSDFGGAVQLVSTFQAPPPGDRVRVVVTLSKAITDTVELSKGRLVWAFTKPQQSAPAVVMAPPPAPVPTVPPAPAWKAPPPPPAPSAAPVLPPISQARAAVFTGLGQSISTNTDSRPRPARRRRFTGRKINIDIKDGDIHNILRLLAKEGNVNIVTSDEVDGTVTMHLKLVPWDQALDIILRTKGLDMVREGDIIRIAKAESIAKERENELKKIEVKEKLKPLEVKLISVNHADAKDLMPRVKSVLSSRGKSEFDERTNTVILKDVDDHLDAAEDLIRRLDTQTPQVLIETRIVEVNEVNVHELGIQWGFDSVNSVGTGNPTGLRFPSSIGISGGSDDQQTVTEGVSSNPNFVVNLPAAAGNGAGGAIGLTFGSIDSTFNLNVRLSALENIGSVKIISSPKITTLDNKRARISQGVSIPISQISASGVQTIFFDAVLALEVMPHVTQDGNIYLEIKAENNTPDFQNVGARGDPTILKKEAETQLLLKDGDTTVIGGIYTSNAGYNRAEVPYLARIPILGAFFRNHRESDRRTELLIFVTPRIVNRAASTVRTAP